MAHHALLLVTFPVICLSAIAQTPFERADQRTPHTGYSHAVAMGSGWAVAGSAYPDDGWGGGAFLLGIGPDGNTLWEHPVAFGLLQSTVSGLAGAPNGDIVSASMLIDCDVLMSYFLAERIAPDGSTIWSRTYPFDNVNALAVAANGDIAFSTGTGILITNADGDSLTWFGTPGTYSMDLIWDGDSSLLTNRWDGLVARWSYHGGFLAADTVAGSITDMAHWHGHRLVLTTGGVLRKLNEVLSVTDSMDLGDGFAKGRLLPLTDRLLVLGNEHMTELDTTLAITSMIPVDPDNEFPADLFSAFAANDSMVLMTSTSGVGGISAGLVRSLVQNGDHEPHGENVGITILAIDSVYYHLQNGIVQPQVDVTVRVTNLGPTVVNDVLVAHKGINGIACGYYGTSQHVHNAGLAPGAAMDIPLPGLWLYYAPWDFVTLDQPVCIAALSPNDLYDRDHSDNYACDTAHIVLGIDDVTVTPVFVVTNPISDAIDMRFPEPRATPQQVELWDATGRRVGTTLVPAGSGSYHWPLPDLHNGVYFFRMEYSGVLIARKLLRQGD
ncbi:MAG: T9SS type A sorting domain-containing protein [Bacteroidetes bacterium]|nr:T9SS type A sorting domain-containing protein [Bacteroidota bacterium]HMU14565.1 hypothetical protein [Flavobacteriales bacterium]